MGAYIFIRWSALTVARVYTVVVEIKQCNDDSRGGVHYPYNWAIGRTWVRSCIGIARPLKPMVAGSSPV